MMAWLVGLFLALAVGAGFIAAASIGFRKSLWIVAIALAAHRLLDLFHGALIDNPGVSR